MRERNAEWITFSEANNLRSLENVFPKRGRKLESQPRVDEHRAAFSCPNNS